MGILEKIIRDWRDEYNIPDTDGIEEISETMKRQRAGSVAGSVVSTQPKRKNACVSINALYTYPMDALRFWMDGIVAGKSSTATFVSRESLKFQSCS